MRYLTPRKGKQGIGFVSWTEEDGCEQENVWKSKAESFTQPTTP